MPNSVTEYVVESARAAHAEHGPGAGGDIVRGLIAEKKYAPAQLDLRELAELSLGRYAFEGRLREYGQRAGWVAESSTEAVDLSLFRSVIQANVGAVMDAAYVDEASVTDQLLGTEPDEMGMDPLTPIRHPISATATDPPRDVAPATEYPRTAFAPYYLTTPIPDKVGLIAALTLETVKANAVRRFLNASAEVARKVAIEERKRKLRVVLGITNNYSRNGTGYNTFLTSGDRVNRLTNFVVATGPTELDRLAQLFDAMTNPFTGEPMSVDPRVILTVRGNLFGLRQSLGVQEIRVTNAAGQVVAANPFDFGGQILTDRYVFNMLVAERGLTAAQAATWVLIGDPQRAFKWREVEPFHRFEVGPNDESWTPHFFQDIVYATKARFWGVAYVADPFAVAEAYNAAAA